MNEQTPTNPRPALLAVTWLWVVLPFGYGLVELARQIVQLFTG
ncbi:MFS transporter small subunit [Bounagaea algeriensis]